MNADEFTPVERCMLDTLSDGCPHSPQELFLCLADDLGPLRNIRTHLSNIRKKLRPSGETIVCEIYNRTVHYRHVRLLPAAGTG